MKKVLLLSIMLAAFVVAPFSSCKKNEMSLLDSSNAQVVDHSSVTIDESDSGTRLSLYELEHLKAIDIVSDSIVCNFLFDSDDMYYLGMIDNHYAFCVPCEYSYQYLIVLPNSSTAFLICDSDGNFGSNNTEFFDTPRVNLRYEVLNACSLLLFSGQINPSSLSMSFVVSYIDTETISDPTLLDYNLSTMASNVALGSYTYQGDSEGIGHSYTLNQYLLGIAKSCYYYFY